MVLQRAAVFHNRSANTDFEIRKELWYILTWKTSSSQGSMLSKYHTFVLFSMDFIACCSKEEGLRMLCMELPEMLLKIRRFLVTFLGVHYRS